MTDETQRYFDTEIPETGLGESELSQSSDALSVSFAQVDSAEDYEAMAAELTRAAEHCRTAAQRVLADDLEEGASHGLAARGHVQRALQLFDQVSIRHADHIDVDGE